MSSEYNEQMGWKSLAASRLSSFRNRLAQTKNEQQTWREWAGQKVTAVARRGQQQVTSSERVALFPGWAARRYQVNESGSSSTTAFEVDIFISGYASSHRAPEFASRSQRAFIRVAKGFASLPKLGTETPDDPLKGAGLSRSTEDLLKDINLPPSPENDAEIQVLERQFQTRTILADQDSMTSRSSSRSGGREPSQIVDVGGEIPPTYSPSEIRRFHANLEARLQPFWSSILSNRQVRIRLYTSIRNPTTPSHDGENGVNTPVIDEYLTTNQEGSFQRRFRVKWEDMCQHPGALHIAFGDAKEEHDLLVVAELLATVPPQYTEAANNEYFPKNLAAQVAAKAEMAVPLTHSPIRVVSDIDDTIKFSSILSGTRSVFRNVFVKELSETVIPGMGEWYTNMWTRGVRFHYVSNGPFELLPVVNEFFQISRLPPGSIKLRSYAGRSIFNGLLSAPAARKRAGIEDILTSFPDSRFILIGDTGEQDLELYAELAREKPDQILGVFLRDADDLYLPIDDPTGIHAASAIPREIPTRKNSNRPYPVAPSRRNTETIITQPQPQIAGYLTTAPETHSYPPLSKSVVDDTDRRPLGRDTASSISSFDQRMNYATYKEHPVYLRMTDVERKRCDLQMRVYKARVIFSGTIPLRVFRNPRECTEVWETLEREGL